MKLAKAAWTGRSVPALSLTDIEALVSSEIPYIHIPRFLSLDWCAEISRRFLSRRLQKYVIGIMKVRMLGLTLPSAPPDRKSYFDRVPEMDAVLRGIYSGGEDPLSKVHREMTAGTGWKRFDAREKGRPFAPDMIGALYPGARVPIHCDTPLHQPDAFDSRLPCQLSWNVYVSASRQGGRLKLYRKLFAPEDRVFHDEIKGFSPAVVAGADSAEFAPSPGDFLMFNSAHFHEVRMVKGAVPRINAHSWMRVNPSRKKFGIWT